MKIIFKFILLICCCSLLSVSYADNSPLDSEIVNVINSELALDEDLDSFDVLVSAQNGAVHLEGEVDSTETKNQIIDIARSTSGVVKIDAEKLVVNPYQ